jgi:hypothetical protein
VAERDFQLFNAPESSSSLNVSQLLEKLLHERDAFILRMVMVILAAVWAMKKMSIWTPNRFWEISFIPRVKLCSGTMNTKPLAKCHKARH